MQKSALAGSGGRHDGDHLSLPQTQVGVRQNREALRAAPVDFLKASRFHHHGGCASRARRSAPDWLACVVLRLGHTALLPVPSRASYRTASLNLDATKHVAVVPGRCKVSPAIAQEFPISAMRLPVSGKAGQHPHWNTLKLPFFNNL